MNYSPLFCRESLKPQRDWQQQGQTEWGLNLKKKKKKKSAAAGLLYACKLLLPPGLMQNNGWPFPSKPHPASLGSGLMGIHGYRPHTSPPFFYFFFQGKRLEEEKERRREKESRYWYLAVLVSLMLIGSLRLHKAVHYHARARPPQSLRSAQLSWRGINWAQTRLVAYAVSGRLFVPTQCQALKSLLRPARAWIPRQLLALLSTERQKWKRRVALKIILQAV